MNEQEIIQKYRDIVQRYTDEEVSATEFSLQYLDVFKNEESGLSEKTYQILQNMFAEADAYCEDPELRGEWEIGEEELREAALETTAALEQRLEEIEQ